MSSASWCQVAEACKDGSQWFVLSLLLSLKTKSSSMMTVSHSLPFLVSEELFDEEFDKWFAKNDNDEQSVCTKNSYGEETEANFKKYRFARDCLIILP